MIKAFDEEVMFNLEDTWKSALDNLLKAAYQICGCGKVSARQRVTWWWNNELDTSKKIGLERSEK